MKMILQNEDDHHSSMSTSLPVLEMKIWIYRSVSNSWIYFYIVLNFLVLTTFTGLGPENCISILVQWFFRKLLKCLNHTDDSQQQWWQYANTSHGPMSQVSKPQTIITKIIRLFCLNSDSKSNNKINFSP
jgi:hypothetical protein